METRDRRAIHGAAATRHPAGQSDGSDNLSATFAANRAFPAAVAEFHRWANTEWCETLSTLR